MIKKARALNPEIEILVRTHSEEEADLLMKETVEVFIGEHELAKSITSHLLKRYGRQGEQTRAIMS